MAARLTDAHIRSAKPRPTVYKLTDGNGLFLLVHPNGSRYWRYRYRIGGAENVFAIGLYPAITLQQARAARDEARRLVKSGTHPSRSRKESIARAAAEATNTFEALARQWIEANQAHWTPYYLKQVKTFLSADVFPSVGAAAPRAITPHQILTIVQGIANRGATTVATLVRQWCSAIFRFGVANLICDSDPAATVKGAIKRAKVRHKQALSRADLLKLAADLDAEEMTPARLALKLLMLTFVRPGELRGARWEEFDFQAMEWRIPASRMKMREEHIVPLSRQTGELLQQLRDMSQQPTGALFPNTRQSSRVMSPTTLNRLLERMGWSGKFSAHGFRATASTLLNERGYRSEVIERQLAHRERNKVRASYNHASYLAERRKLMQEWADSIEAQLATPDLLAASASCHSAA